MRLVDADALEEILEKIPAADIKNMGGQAYVLVKLSQVFNVIDNQPTTEERKWISCSERLPKEDGQYFITEKGLFGDYLYVGIANYGVPMMPMNKGKGRGWFITDSEGDYYCDMNYVLAWMPLPEPYEERRER